MKYTNWEEKIESSIINAMVALTLSIPFWFLMRNVFYWKWSVVAIFFIYEMICFFTPGKRDIGMFIVKTQWEAEPKFSRYLLYNILYTLSFATLFIYIWFPLDLLFFNLLLIQLPFVLITDDTLHGWLSKMMTVK